MSNRRGTVVPGAEGKMDKFKEEVAGELGIDVPHGRPDKMWGAIPAERCGEVGGNMVKKMIESFEKNLIK